MGSVSKISNLVLLKNKPQVFDKVSFIKAVLSCVNSVNKISLITFYGLSVNCHTLIMSCFMRQTPGLFNHI